MRLAFLLVFAFQLAPPVGVQDGKTGTLTGWVLPPADGREAARTVWVDDRPTPVGSDGSFQATAIPPGPTHLAIETSEGLYVVASPVTVAPGASRSLQLAFGGREDTSAPAPSEKDKKKKPAGIWANPAAATLIIIGSAIVVGLVVDEFTKPDSHPVTPVSPSVPTFP